MSSRSASTFRLRVTYAYYSLLVVLAATAGRPAPLPPLAEQAAGAIAVLLVALACFGRIWCSAFLAGHKDTRLVTDGPYSVCRHPLYAFSLVGGLGLGIATRSLTLTLLTLTLLGSLFARAARDEERTLMERHGTAFREYARTVPRWWPRLSAFHLPAQVDLRPRIFRKAFLDAGSFVLLYVLIDTARALRDSGMLPTLLPLP